MNDDMEPAIVVSDLKDSALVFKSLVNHLAVLCKALIVGAISVPEYLEEACRVTRLQKDLYQGIGTIPVEPAEPLSEAEKDAFGKIITDDFRGFPEV